LGDCFLWASFYNIIEEEEMFGVLISTVKFCIGFDKKWVGPHFGQYFQMTIWSPCHRGSLLIVAQYQWQQRLGREFSKFVKLSGKLWQ
jgi:hypothetical protein